MYEGCHRYLHRVGRDRFEQWAAINLKTEAERIENLWQSHSQMEKTA